MKKETNPLANLLPWDDSYAYDGDWVYPKPPKHRNRVRRNKQRKLKVPGHGFYYGFPA